MTTQRPMTVGEIARMMGVAPRTVSKWVDSGRLRGYRLPMSRDRRVEVEDLRKFFVENGTPLDRLEEYVAGRD